MKKKKVLLPMYPISLYIYYGSWKELKKEYNKFWPKGEFVKYGLKYYQAWVSYNPKKRESDIFVYFNKKYKKNMTSIIVHESFHILDKVVEFLRYEDHIGGEKDAYLLQWIFNIIIKTLKLK